NLIDTRLRKPDASVWTSREAVGSVVYRAWGTVEIATGRDRRQWRQRVLGKRAARCDPPDLVSQGLRKPHRAISPGNDVERAALWSGSREKRNRSVGVDASD